MARPDTQHEEKKARLVQAATAAFARYGYDGTTNRRIAEEMRRSTGREFTPALIYHYFPGGKLQLFAAVMRQYQPIREFGQALLEQADAPPQVFLRRAARSYLRLLKEPTTSRLARILLAEGPRHPELARELVGYIVPLFVLPVVGYLRRQTELGRLKPMDPLAAMFEFFGPLLVRAFIADMLGDIQPPFPLPDDDTMIERHVETFLHGVAVRDE